MTVKTVSPPASVALPPPAAEAASPADARLLPADAPSPPPTPCMWISERLTSNAVYNHGVARLIHSERTAFQDMLIADIGPYGRALFLDSFIQTTTGDEAHYHEPIAHVALQHHPAPRDVLILGGGDGATAREALRWPCVRRVVNVDIDEKVVAACRKHMPALSAGAFEDARTTLVIDDALHFLKETDAHVRYDVIICDLTDPIEHGPSNSLFTLEFFELVRSRLSARGAMCLQSGTISLQENPTTLPRIYNTLSQVFPHVNVMQIFAPTYGTPLALSLVTMQPLNLPNADDIDRVFETLTGRNRVLDGRAVHGLFAIPKYVSDALKSERGVYTSANKVKSLVHGICEVEPIAT